MYSFVFTYACSRVVWMHLLLRATSKHPENKKSLTAEHQNISFVRLTLIFRLLLISAVGHHGMLELTFKS